MALTSQTMTDEQRKSVAIEYLKAFDNGGVTSTGGSILDLFADDAQVYFPKWGIANGREEIGQMFGDVGGTLKSIRHHYANFNWVFSGGDMLVCRGDQPRRAPRRAVAGRACPSGARAAGATCSRSATGRSSAASSTSTPTTPAGHRALPVARGACRRRVTVIMPPREADLRPGTADALARVPGVRRRPGAPRRGPDRLLRGALLRPAGDAARRRLRALLRGRGDPPARGGGRVRERAALTGGGPRAARAHRRRRARQHRPARADLGRCC